MQRSQYKGGLILGRPTHDGVYFKTTIPSFTISKNFGLKLNMVRLDRLVVNGVIYVNVTVKNFPKRITYKPTKEWTKKDLQKYQLV